MSPEEKVILEKLESAVSENNRMLKKLVWQGKMNLLTKAIYWTLIILIALGALAVVKPLLNNFANIYTSDSKQDSFKIFGTQSALEELRSSFEE